MMIAKIMPLQGIDEKIAAEALKCLAAAILCERHFELSTIV